MAASACCHTAGAGAPAFLCSAGAFAEESSTFLSGLLGVLTIVAFAVAGEVSRPASPPAFPILRYESRRYDGEPRSGQPQLGSSSPELAIPPWREGVKGYGVARGRQQPGQLYLQPGTPSDQAPGQRCPVMGDLRV